MSNTSTVKMLQAYEQKASPTLFFTGFFQAPESNFHNSEFVEIDIQRTEEDIAIVVTDLSTGTRMNSADLYTNKRYKPPIFDETAPINSWDLIKRQVGDNPFESLSFRANIVSQMLSLMINMGDKINRTIELQASQVMQTGIIILSDSAGVPLYSIDFKPKATHYPTAGTAWGQVGADPMGDIDALAEVNRDDGKLDSDIVVFGKDAWKEFVTDANVQALLDNRRINKGDIVRTQNRGNGGKFHGTIDIENYTYELWTYGGRYKDPQSGDSTQYMDPSKAVVMSSGTRLDATFGSIPNIGSELGSNNQVTMSEIPGRIMAGGVGMSPLLYTSNDGRQLFGNIGTRALMIPTAIDTFGCIETGA